MPSVAVRVSGLGQNVGLGLYAARDFEPGEYIAPYRGLVRRGACPEGYPSDYVFEWRDETTGETFHSDALDDPCPAMYCNDAEGPIRVAGLENNAYFDTTERLRPCLRAISPICARDEIFVGYGTDYWCGRD